MFRYKRGIRVSYIRQGLIYFISRSYRDLPAGVKRRLEGLCMETGGEYYQALLDFVTTDDGADMVCTKHFLSRSTLERAVRRYYIAFDEDWCYILFGEIM